MRSDIPSQLLTKHSFPNDIEGLFVEINSRKSKWLLIGTYNPPSQNDQYYFDCLGKALDVYSSYETIILTEGFNSQQSECVFDSFLYQHDLTNLVKEGTCYKNPGNLSRIDLYLTNTPLSSQNTSSVFTGFSDFHKLVLTVFKTTFVKCKLKKFFYRDYKHFNHESFEKDLKCALSTFEKINYQEFDKTFIETLNKHAPLKKKLVRANQPPYMTKALRKAIMRRYELETKYFKLKTNDTLKAYKKQKNYCSRLYKKERKKFFENLNLSFVVDNKKFSKLVKPLFNEKGGGVSNEVVLLEKDKILRDNNEVPKEFHSYFNSIVSSLRITENEYTIQKNISSSEPIDKAIMLFRF